MAPTGMSFSSILIQLLNGLAAASSLFLVSAGLSLIFGVTRIVNFAHGSLYMLGLYIAYSLIEALGRTPLGFWSARRNMRSKRVPEACGWRPASPTSRRRGCMSQAGGAATANFSTITC